MLYQEIIQLRNLSYEMIQEGIAGEESEESLPNDSQLVQCDLSECCKPLELTSHEQCVKNLVTIFERECKCRLIGRSLPSIQSSSSDAN